MGTMEKMRQTSPYFLAAFAVLFVGFMVASDADIGNLIGRRGSNVQTEVIGKINGEKILYKDFDAKVKEAREAKLKQAKDPNAQIDEDQLINQVWSQIVDETLLNQEAKKAGVIVTDDEIRDMMLNNPPESLKRSFMDSSGNFNKQLYLEIVTNPDLVASYAPQNLSKEEKVKAVQDFKDLLLNVEKYTRQQKLIQDLVSTVTSSISVISPLYAQERYENENTTANVNFIYFPKDDIKDQDVQVTEKEVKDYYDKHKQAFRQKPAMRMEYIKFDIVPLPDDTIRAAKKVDKITSELAIGKTPQEKDSIFDVLMSEYNGNLNDYTNIKDVPEYKLNYLQKLNINDIAGPVMLPDGIFFFRLEDKRSGTNEVVKASHILIKFGNNKDSAKAKADDILQKAKSGEDFATLAKMYSEDKGSAQQGGDLGWFGKGQMIKPFEEAAFAATPGTIVGPVESEYGYHIIKVVDKQSEEIKYSEIQVKPVVSTNTRNRLFRDAYSFQKQVSEGASFDELAKKSNYNPVQTMFFLKGTPVLGSQYISDIAFDNDVGTVLQPIEMKNNQIIVAKITDSRKEGFRPYEDMKEYMKNKVIGIKKLNMLKERADEVYRKVEPLGLLTNANTVDPSLQVKTLVGVQNNGNVQGIGEDYVFTANAASLPINQISLPVRGTLGYYIMQVLSRLAPNAQSEKTVLPVFIKNMSQGLSQKEFYQWFGKIRENSKIEDYRSRFYKDY
jgi:peptidyl-prolyl cis-trans isomerase D